MAVSIARAIMLAANAIADADALLITAGAGMSVDSGPPDYRSKHGLWRAYPPLEKLGLAFEQMAQPRWFESKPKMAWAWYNHRQQLYRDTEPHGGYGIIKDWAQAMPAGGFVFTSNVDGHFERAGFDPDRILECHGNIFRYQCVTPCRDAVWVDEPLELGIDLTSLWTFGELPRCPECGTLARPNVLMFEDFDWVPGVTRQQREAYANWLDSLAGKRVVILEFGAGTEIATVRVDGEREARRFGGTLIRVNPAASEADEGAISVPLGALEALAAMQDALSKELHLR